MTVVSLFSLKGSPGVTTLASLLGAAWPGSRGPVLVEADPAGGDLAARFGLSARVGWASLISSTRRSVEAPTLTAHLQALPGGLPVLVGARGTERRSATTLEGSVVRSGPHRPAEDGSGLLIVDLGRLDPDDEVSCSWLEASDASMVVVRGDVSSAVHLRDRAGGLTAHCRDRLGTVVVGGRCSGSDLEDFSGVAPFGIVPFDPAAADVASGGSGAGRRLERSPLWLAVVRLAASLDERTADDASPGRSARAGGADGPPPDGPSRVAPATPSDAPATASTRVGHRRLRDVLLRRAVGTPPPVPPAPPAAQWSGVPGDKASRVEA